ncbi:LOW QUALITY PROTEIN: olfactory receptor 6B1-like [Cariama cristata]
MSATEKQNQTYITAFTLLGDNDLPDVQIPLFLLFLVTYVVTMMGNILILMLVVMSKGGIVGCMTHFFSSFMCTECVLSATAYNCYVAICQPLRYPVMMTYQMCIYLVVVSWFSGFPVSLIKISFISQFCDCHATSQFFCDISPVLNLTCTDMAADFVLILFTLLVPLFITIVSYLLIMMTILQIPNTQSKEKAFSMCSSHLTVITIFFSATLFMYTQPKKVYPFDLNKLVSAVCTIVTPILNPSIYCLRNVEVKRALKKALCEKVGISELSRFIGSLQMQG